MDVDEALAAKEAGASLATPEPYSAEWWHERTTTELREIIKRGFSLGAAYDGAVVETERRAREALRRVREDQSLAVQRNAKIRLVVLGVVLALVIVAGLVEWLAG